MFKKIVFLVLTVFFISITTWGSIKGYRSLMIGFSAITVATIFVAYVNEQLKKHSAKKSSIIADSLEQRPHKVVGSWVANSGYTQTVLVPLVYEDEYWDPKRFCPRIVSLDDAVPESVYVEPVVEKTKNNYRIIDFLDFPKERIRKTQNGDRMIRKPNLDGEAFG